MRESTLRYISALDQAMGRASLSRSALVYRAIRASYVPRPGVLFEDYGFGSYTLSRDKAREYTLDTYGEDETPTIVEMILPKGSRAIPVGDAGYDSEFEILLGRGAIFRVVSDRYERLDSEARKRLRVARIEHVGFADAERTMAEESEPTSEQTTPRKFLWDTGDIVLLSAVSEGGEGSGHHDHKGIPGHWGGSLPRWRKGLAPAVEAILQKSMELRDLKEKLDGLYELDSLAHKRLLRAMDENPSDVDAANAAIDENMAKITARREEMLERARR